MATGGGYRQMIGNQLVDSMVELGKLDLDGIDVQRLIWRMLHGSLTRLVSNCEEIEDWDIEDSGEFNAVEETSTKLTGSTSLELATDSSVTTLGTYVKMDDEHKPDNENWDGFNFLVLMVRDDTTARAATDLAVQISNAGVWQTVKYVPVVSNVDCWECKVIEIRDWDRSKVDGFRFVNYRNVASKTVYVDTIEVTDLVAGYGDGVVLGTGPVIGPVIPMRMDTGTIYPGNAANLEHGLVESGAENDVGIVGLVCADKNMKNIITATDSVPNMVWVARRGAIVRMRNDSGGSVSGDPVALTAGNKTVADQVTDTEEAFARCLDTGTANFDSLFRIGKTYADD